MLFVLQLSYVCKYLIHFKLYRSDLRHDCWVTSAIQNTCSESRFMWHTHFTLVDCQIEDHEMRNVSNRLWSPTTKSQCGGNARKLSLECAARVSNHYLINLRACATAMGSDQNIQGQSVKEICRFDLHFKKRLLCRAALKSSLSKATLGRSIDCLNITA